MTFAGTVLLITRGMTGIGETAVRLITSFGAWAGLLYGISEEAEGTTHCRLRWPWNKGAANVSCSNEGRSRNTERGRNRQRTGFGKSRRR